jgi:hypothetical protein
VDKKIICSFILSASIIELSFKAGCRFSKKPAQQSVHLTGGILCHFWALSTPEQNPALEVLSTPAHPQVTPAVGRQLG